MPACSLDRPRSDKGSWEVNVDRLGCGIVPASTGEFDAVGLQQLEITLAVSPASIGNQVIGRESL